MSDDTDRVLRDALIDSYTALVRSGIDALVVGGVALAYHIDGEAQVDHDVDLLVAEPSVDAAMRGLAEAGFDVTDTHPTWLFKARRDGALVDVLYRLGRHLVLDAEMLERALDVPVDGVPLRFVSREDLAVGQAGAAKREVPGLWFQVFDLIGTGDVDWEYLARRASVKPQLRAAVLHYAKHLKLDVPDDLLTTD